MITLKEAKKLFESNKEVIEYEYLQFYFTVSETKSEWVFSPHDGSGVIFPGFPSFSVCKNNGKVIMNNGEVGEEEIVSEDELPVFVENYKPKMHD